MTTEALRKLIKDYQLGLRDGITPYPLKGVVGGYRKEWSEEWGPVMIVRMEVKNIVRRNWI